MFQKFQNAVGFAGFVSILFNDQRTPVWIHARKRSILTRLDSSLVMLVMITPLLTTSPNPNFQKKSRVEVHGSAL